MSSLTSRDDSLYSILSLALKNIELKSLAKKTDDYYRNILTKISQGDSLSWNFPAFFFTFYWFLYRKMYILAFIVMLFFFSLNGVFGVLNELTMKLEFGNIVIFSWLITMVLSGCFGNWFYYRSLSHRVKKGYNLVSVRPTDGWGVFLGVFAFPIPIISFIIGLCRTISVRQKIFRARKYLDA